FSSEFTNSPGPWSAFRATGAPDVFRYFDDQNAWTAANEDGPPEFITLGYATPVFANGVTIREVFSNGFVTQIDLVDTNDALHTPGACGAPSGNPTPPAPENFSISFPTTPYQVKGVKVTIDPNHVLGAFEDIDAVGLQGVTSITPVPINTFNGGEPG